VSAVISARTFVIECCDGRSSAAIPTAAELLLRKLLGMHAAVMLLEFAGPFHVNIGFDRLHWWGNGNMQCCDQQVAD